MSEGLREGLRPRIGTIASVAFAALAVVLTWADPFAEADDGVLLVNNRSGGRRVFPTLVDADPSKATVELQAPDGPVVRIAPNPDGGGHQLLHGDELLGPVAPADFEGLWSSLRLATAQRTATRGQRVGQRGVIRISLPDETLTLALGDAVAGGGVYGAFEANGDTWVVETEMLTLVEQRPRSWLGKRLLPLDVDAVTSLGWADELVLARGDDGFWRIRDGAMSALLSTEAVEFFLRRLLRARIDPFIERTEVASDSLRPHVVVTTRDGSSRPLLVGEACPGHAERRVVDRGAGLLGCVDAQLFEPWPLLEPEAGMVESRLVPHDYPRIVAIELDAPVARSLVRRGGEWFYSEQGGAAGPVDRRAVAEEEVRRWFAGLSGLEVALVTAPREPAPTPERGEGVEPEGGEPERETPGDPDGDARELAEVEGGGVVFEPDWAVTIHADSGDTLTLRCMLGGGGGLGPRLCLRDEGPLLRLLGEPPLNLVFDAQTFAPRDLTLLEPGEVTQLEILPPATSEGGVEAEVVRQSVHDDAGQWQLDAPVHVDDNGAIDLVRLENLLWALQNLRAQAWVEPPSETPLRRIVAEVVPNRGRRYTLRLSVFPNCVVEVQGQRPAAVSEAQCAALGEDLMFDDPIRFWIERARAFELEGHDRQLLIRRRDEHFVGDDGGAIEDPLVAEALASWVAWRSAGIRAGEPPGKVEWRLDIRRDFGPPAVVEIGPGWARLEGASWYYVERESTAGE